MKNYPDPENITAVILAGGKARRFEGADKGLVQFRQRAIIEHVIGAIKPQLNNILINANRNQLAYAAFGYPVVSDELSDFQGPLAGFITGMRQITTPYMLTLPCDGPLISDDYVARMIDTAVGEKVDIVVAHDGHRLQPVHTLISVELVASLDAYLARGERKIDRWFNEHTIGLADFADSPQVFSNINTKEELNELEQNND